MTPTPTPTPAGWQNASSSLSTGFASASDFGGVLVLLLYIVGALLAAQFIAPWLARSQLLTSVSERLAQSMAYAVKGLAASAVLAALGLPIWLLATADGETQGAALEVIGVLAIGYVALVGIGWLADHAVTRFIDAHPDVDSWDDLWPDAEDPDLSDPVTDGGDET